MLVCINEDGNEEGWVLNEEVVELIGSHPQADGIEVIHQEVDGGEGLGGFFSIGCFYCIPTLEVRKLVIQFYLSVYSISLVYQLVVQFT